MIATSLSNMNENKTYKTAVLDALDKAVQEVFGNNLEHFFCPSHKREICDVRMMTLKIFREHTDYPYQEIGRTFGKHHATIIHNIKWANTYIEVDKKFAHDYELLTKTFQKFLSE